MRDPVTCAVCGREWERLDPAVRWWSIDSEWACVDEAACFARSRGLVEE